MSDTVKSRGYIAVLRQKIDEDKREEIAEDLYDRKSPLDFNYEGTLLISDEFKHDYDARRDIYNHHIGQSIAVDDDLKAFINAAKKEGFDIDVSTIQPYSCIWYNGSDSPIDALTLPNYLEDVRSRVVFNKDYSGESIVDIDRDMSEMFDDRYNPAMKDVPVDEHGIHEGSFAVTVTWIPD